MKKLLVIAFVLMGFLVNAQEAELLVNNRDLPNGTKKSDVYARNIYRLSPNPASETITIEGFVVNNKPHFVIYDAAGRQVEKGIFSIENNTLNISALNPGMYFITIINDSEKHILRLVKQ
jgi:hypothetical protein